MAEHKSLGGWMDVTNRVRNDIVFEGRNKDYGAYFVRRKYQKFMLIALAIAAATLVIGISVPLLLKLLNAKSAEEVINVKVNLTAPPPINPNLPPPPPPPPPPPKPLIKELKVTPPKIVKVNVDTTIATVKQIQQTNVGTVNQKGKDTMVIQPIAAPSAIGEDVNKIFTIVQQMPKFPGDIYKYLADHIEYPEQAKEANIQGTVYVSFVVEKDGSISSVKVLRGVNSYLDDEAVRVISNMPKWAPGEQNGHTVRVQYNVPIRFVLR